MRIALISPDIDHVYLQFHGKVVLRKALLKGDRDVSVPDRRRA